MNEELLKQQCERLAMRVLILAEQLPLNLHADVLCKQVVRATTSAAANYHAASQKKSKREIIARLRCVVEETNESIYWLKLLANAHITDPAPVLGIIREMQELLAGAESGIQKLQRC